MLQISTVVLLFLHKGPGSQREHKHSHETCPRKTATPATCRDCQCGPPNPPGSSHGLSMGRFNYTRKIVYMRVCVYSNFERLFEPNVLSNVLQFPNSPPDYMNDAAVKCLEGL